MGRLSDGAVVVAAEGEDVFHEVVEFFGRDRVFVEAGHRAEAEAHLSFHEEAGEGFVIDRRAEAAFATGMAGVAVLGKDALAARESRVGGVETTLNGFTAANGTAGGGH